MTGVVPPRLEGWTSIGLIAGVVVACSRPPGTGSSHAPDAAAHAADAAAPATCGEGRAMTVHFYDVGEGLAVLVDLPDGRHVLVDTGDEPRRSGCGESCAASSAHLLSALRADLHGAPIDLLWLTHPHSDHIGGAPLVLGAFPVLAYVDDGRDTSRAEVRRARRAAQEHGVAMRVVEPGNAQVPLASSKDLRFRAIVPSAWPAACTHDPNECSIGLRIDACASSVLLLGDAEHEEEALLDPGGPVTLLQVPHHGSETSTSPAFLARARPRYAVISAGKAGEGRNREYCHPRAIVVKRLSRVLEWDSPERFTGSPGDGKLDQRDGGGTTRTLTSFDGERCDRATPADWVSVPASVRLWATERDGDVVLTTRGDGVFRQVGER